MKKSSLAIIGLAVAGIGAYFYFNKPKVTSDTGGTQMGNTSASKWQNPPQTPDVSAVTNFTPNGQTQTYVNVPTVSGYAPTGNLNLGNANATETQALVNQLQQVATQQQQGVDNATIINQALTKTAKNNTAQITTFKPYIPSNVTVKSVAKKDSIAYKLGYIK